MVARATAVTTHRPALAATTTWAVPKYPTDSTDCLPSHMAQTHKHDTMSTAHRTHTRSAPCRATAEKLLVDCVSAHPPPVIRHDTQTHRHTTLHQQHTAHTHNLQHHHVYPSTPAASHPTAAHAHAHVSRVQTPRPPAHPHTHCHQAAHRHDTPSPPPSAGHPQASVTRL
jgi:hypothetical protein